MDDFTIQDARGEGMVAHPSTQGALSALAWVAENGLAPLNILDIGCGSGVLSLRAASLWPQSRVVATDISPKALADCSANIAAAGFSDRVSCVRSASAGEAAIGARAPYGLILANVLAAYHVRHAVDYQRISGRGALAVFSGIMAWEAEQVSTAVTSVGFIPQAEFRQGQWVTMVVIKDSYNIA